MPSITRQILDRLEAGETPSIDGLFVAVDEDKIEGPYVLLHEGQWIDGRFTRSIRIDQPTHGAGQIHAHVYGRKGVELGVVNLDGTSSHASKVRLHKKDIAALKARDFNVPDDGIVEWTKVNVSFALLKG